MDNELPNEYIDSAIEELANSIGIAEPINAKQIISLIRHSQIKEALKLIALQLNLPVDINIISVPDNYQHQNSNNKYTTTSLTEKEINGVSHGITAQVEIPSNLPRFGSPIMNGFTINIKISEKATKEPQAFALVIAHELSHVLLYSLNHPQKENEFYTDITAMMSGFLYVFQNGRIRVKTEGYVDYNKTRTTTTTYGYLNDSQFVFAVNKINCILQGHRTKSAQLGSELNKYRLMIRGYMNCLNQFQEYIKFFSIKTSKLISAQDGIKIASFFKPGYIDDLITQMERYGQIHQPVQKFIDDLCCYTVSSSKQVESYIRNLEIETKNVSASKKAIKKDIKVLSRNISLLYKMKVVLALLLKH